MCRDAQLEPRCWNRPEQRVGEPRDHEDDEEFDRDQGVPTQVFPAPAGVMNPGLRSSTRHWVLQFTTVGSVLQARSGKANAASASGSSMRPMLWGMP